MTASTRTVKSVVDVILKYMDPDRAVTMLDELQAVPSNQSFKETLALIRVGIVTENKEAAVFSRQTRTFASLRDEKCGCHECIRNRGEVAIHMVVCPVCGNKRCPKATNHQFTCTGSNEPGQVGVHS